MYRLNTEGKNTPGKQQSDLAKNNPQGASSQMQVQPAEQQYILCASSGTTCRRSQGSTRDLAVSPGLQNRAHKRRAVHFPIFWKKFFSVCHNNLK